MPTAKLKCLHAIDDRALWQNCSLGLCLGIVGLFRHRPSRILST